GVKTVGELIAAAKARPGQINFSSAGVGSGTHFAAEILKSMAAIDVVHVPYKGIPEAMAETVAGRVQFFMAPISNGVNLVRDGRLVGLGVSSRKRDALLPQVPTIEEAGVPGYEQELWFGLLGPAGLPQRILARLNGEIGRILADEETKTRWSPIGIEPRPTPPEEFDRLVRSEIALYTRIARAANITSE
ncbi:MAG TPA: tripartite tricarboxylate transporter substrate-binding protein, partial [Burkholderiales bacterium]|nr:tripartite tricarboxylate transporter substrate-binding protein [Burkholderiales bacterium]